MVQGCLAVSVTAVDLRTQAPGRSGGESSCRPTPRAGDPHAVTPAGVPRNENADGSLAELDRGPRDSIGELRADSEAFRWARAGEARSAPAP